MANNVVGNPLSRLERIPVWPHGYRLLIVLGLGYFFSFFDITNISYGIPVITKQFHVSSSLASTAVSTSLFGYIVGAILVSIISDYYGRRVALLMGIGLYTIGSFATAFSPNVTWLIVWRFIVGMGIGTMIAQVSTYMGEISPAILRGRFTGLANVFAFAGLAAVPFAAMWVVPHYSWGWRALLFFGGLGGLTMLFMANDLIESPRWLIIHGHYEKAVTLVDRIEQRAMAKMGTTTLPPVKEIPLEEKAQGFPLWSLFKPPYVWRMIILLLYWFLWYVGDYAYLGMAPTVLVQSGFGLGNSIGFSAISGIGFIVGALYVLFFGDSIERKYSLIGMGIIGAVAVIIAGFAPSPIMVIVAGFLFTMTIAMLSAIGYIITAEHFPTRARSSGLAMCDGIGHLGGAIAPALTLGAFGSWGITGAFGLMGVATLASLIFMSMTSRATRKNLEVVNDANFIETSDSIPLN
ncbi:MFS transporter [Alicyclobacillus acidoterrestris]|uniref:MFS transporter n=1 Tax=Alicyclobacillus acidoterrestris (strain ATCC 49025 / DSM 3922 / CIP 106132 / NCIMB 13137 / GD3B) TaxID=1356854 RepID=T0BMZ2_ALIAG|nr:MFS transporter [Alicyclobacillus acidoterrestris]EPZ45403.1 MFS transporter [Alicyclobacillus acidoterrestris ATCC 49025]UNO48432.1 MFS transporter [Alicyclobacillus acidoterrestris]